MPQAKQFIWTGDDCVSWQSIYITNSATRVDDADYRNDEVMNFSHIAQTTQCDATDDVSFLSPLRYVKVT